MPLVDHVVVGAVLVDGRDEHATGENTPGGRRYLRDATAVYRADAQRYTSSDLCDR